MRPSAGVVLQLKGFAESWGWLEPTLATPEVCRMGPTCKQCLCCCSYSGCLPHSADTVLIAEETADGVAIVGACQFRRTPGFAQHFSLHQWCVSLSEFALSWMRSFSLYSKGNLASELCTARVCVHRMGTFSVDRSEFSCYCQSGQHILPQKVIWDDTTGRDTCLLRSVWEM